jgi:hypothetical protein
MYRINNHALFVGENFIWLPEDSHIKTVKTIMGKIVLVTLEPLIWARSTQRNIVALDCRRDIDPNWEYIGSIVTTDHSGFQEVITVLDSTPKPGQQL